MGNDIVGEGAGDYSGWSTALSSDGTVLAVGGQRNDGGGRSAGHVRVYINMGGGGWTQLGEDLEGARFDEFGWSVSLSADGMILAVGAWLASRSNRVASGVVSTYGWNGNVWEARGSPIEGQADRDNFGFSVALSNDGLVLAAGANRNDGAGEDAGHVRVFGWIDGDWSQLGSALEGASPGDRFGHAVALSSDGLILAVSANRWLTGIPGYVATYVWIDGAWIPRGNTLNGFAASDQAGVSVSLSGNGLVLAIGAGGRNFCEVYQYDGMDWSQIGQTINIASVGHLARFGFSVALSYSGDTVVVGAPSYEANGSVIGLVQVHRLTSHRERWVLVGQGLVGKSANDSFGVAVSVSHDGSRLAVGAHQWQSPGNPPGYVQVYDLI